ncbi:hypothetical protein IC006_0054 [Sulfuracidifex tepidarius]|uniref:Uncharacterized protein n=1 Tax=Sulfuracidifex tepidarius TaxID=1294262 RepID=A0A510DRJ8_9CREN|nr:hypothetical protein IC006_0054 [Sulfuracidifex tepidarius]BBG25549.1 hypothetical protein IC007_0054 [Sulfuracidifex tepidarius]
MYPPLFVNISKMFLPFLGIAPISIMSLCEVILVGANDLISSPFSLTSSISPLYSGFSRITFIGYCFALIELLSDKP